MAEAWEILLSAGAAGLVGYFIRRLEEKHEREKEYRKELKKHLPDLIEPLFSHLSNLWQSLVTLIDWERGGDKLVRGRLLKQNLSEVEQALDDLREFTEKNETKINLLFPHPLQFWRYVQLSMFVQDIIEAVKQRKSPTDDIHEIVNSTTDMQDDLQKLVGFKMKARLKSEYVFRETPLSFFERLKQKLGFL